MDRKSHFNYLVLLSLTPCFISRWDPQQDCVEAWEENGERSSPVGSSKGPRPPGLSVFPQVPLPSLDFLITLPQNKCLHIQYLCCVLIPFQTSAGAGLGSFPLPLLPPAAAAESCVPGVKHVTLRLILTIITVHWQLGARWS